MNRNSIHKFDMLRTSEAPDGTVTGEENIRVVFDYYPAEPATYMTPGSGDTIEIACVEVEDFSTRPISWKEAPRPRFPGDFDYLDYAESHTDQLIQYAREEREYQRAAAAEMARDMGVNRR